MWAQRTSWMCTGCCLETLSHWNRPECTLRMAEQAIAVIARDRVIAVIGRAKAKSRLAAN